MNPDPSANTFKVGGVVEVINDPFRGTQVEIVEIDYIRNEITLKSFNPIIRIQHGS